MGQGLGLHCLPRCLGAEHSPLAAQTRSGGWENGCVGGWTSKCSFDPKDSKLDPKHNSSTSYSPRSLAILWKHLRFLFTSWKTRAYPCVLITVRQQKPHPRHQPHTRSHAGCSSELQSTEQWLQCSGDMQMPWPLDPGGGELGGHLLGWLH